MKTGLKEGFHSTRKKEIQKCYIECRKMHTHTPISHGVGGGDVVFNRAGCFTIDFC